MGLEHRGRGRKNGREKLDYDTINTDQASGRPYAGDAHKEGSEAFTDFAGRDPGTAYTKALAGCKKEAGTVLQLYSRCFGQKGS